MEPHAGRVEGLELPGEVSLARLWELAESRMATDEGMSAYAASLRTLRPAVVTPELFWREYLWVVYVSGLSARVVASMWPRIVHAIGPHDLAMSLAWLQGSMLAINSNARKSQAAWSTREELIRLGWGAFRELRLSSLDALASLPMVGRVTRYHLARNLGYDVVKPDVHMVRLAKAYGFDSPLALCEDVRRLTEERLGVIDLALWSYCAAAGTGHLK